MRASLLHDVPPAFLLPRRCPPLRDGAGRTRRSGPDQRAALLERAHAAWNERAWADAHRLLEEADGLSPLGAADLERLAMTSAYIGRDDRMIEIQERLFRIHEAAGDACAAARAAFWIGFRLSMLGETGRGGGWLARAGRLIEAHGQPCVEQGYLLLPRAYRHMAAREWDRAFDCARGAAEAGDRFGDADLAALGCSLQGVARLREGRVTEGLALFDETMLATASQELSTLATGLVFCTAIAQCQRVFAFDRAREWTLALASLCESQPQLVTFNAPCRLHMAELCQLQGRWSDAVAEAERVSEGYGQNVPEDASGPSHYQIAEIHRLRGELHAAERGYRQASELGRDPQPGLALLRLAQGDPVSALNALRRVLESERDPMQRARFLPAAVEAFLAADDLDGAGECAEELARIAAGHDHTALNGIADEARGAVLLASGRAGDAAAPLRQAFAAWQRVGAPYLAARVRARLGDACEALGDVDGARLEREAARAVFTDLEARPDLERLARASGGTSPGMHGLTARELEVLRSVALGKTNRAIAAELHLSGRTVDRHVSNIFGKLAVSSRAAATAWAYEHGLMGAPRG